MKNTRYFTEKVSAWEGQIKRKKRTHHNQCVGRRWTTVALWKEVTKKTMFLIQIFLLEPLNLSQVSELNKNLPQTLQSECLTCNSYLHREWRSFNEKGSLLGVEGWWRHCAASLCDYRRLRGNWVGVEVDLSFGVWVGRGEGFEGRFLFSEIFARVRPPNATRVHSGLLSVCGSSRGGLWLHCHDNPCSLARSHAGQDRHGHRLCSPHAQPVDGGPRTCCRGRRHVLNDCRWGADGFSGSIPGGFLSSCSYRQREQHSPLERWASKNNALDGMRWQMNPGTSDTVQEVWWSVHYLNWLPNKAAFFCIIVTGQSLWARRSCFSCATSFLRWVTSFWQQHKKKYST